MRIIPTSFIKIGIIATVVVMVGVVAVHGETVGTTFATGSGTGGLELKIDSKTFYNGKFMYNLSWHLKNLVPGVDKFFSFDDVKPGDRGTTTISLHIKKNPAWVCLDFENLKDKENGRNEPEKEIDNDGQGELSEELEFFAWRDDGDNVFEVGEEPLFGTDEQKAKVVLGDATYALADSNTGDMYQPNKTKYIGITWCAGDLEVDLQTAEISCDATAMGNEAQTDSMTLDVILRAVSAKQQPWFRCDGGKVPEPCKEKGNNGHGNDDDHNDDSNPGHSNDSDDDTDDDGLPPGFAKKINDGKGQEDCLPKDNNEHKDDKDEGWHYAGHKNDWLGKTKESCVNAWNKTKNKFKNRRW